MSTPKFAETHNLVAFLEKKKPEEVMGLRKLLILIHVLFQYALTGAFSLQALVDKKKVIITETSIRSDLKLDDTEGTDCLPTATIFAEWGTDIAKITRKRSKPDKHGHGNGKSAQELRVSSKGQQSQPWSTLGQPTKQQNLQNTQITLNVKPFSPKALKFITPLVLC
ncbi:hypothetical protein Tco_0647759 [Tanacetum coccineum]